MEQALFMFLANGVASAEATFRDGARHALMLFATGSEIDIARTAAVRGAERNGWTFVEVKRETEISTDTSLIDDDILRHAADKALQGGASIIVYEDEIPLDA